MPTLRAVVIPTLALFASVALPSPSPCQSAAGRPARPALPNWIWHGTPTSNQRLVFRRTFTLDVVRPGSRALLVGSCDNHMRVAVNGKEVVVHGEWSELVSVDVAKHLRKGENVIEVRAHNEGGPAGLALRLGIGKRWSIVTDGAWLAASPDAAQKGRWQKATVLGAVGSDALPWLSIQAETYGAPPAPVPPPGPQKPRGVEGMHLPAGFRAELVYRVPRGAQGSWVALAAGAAGELFASDQGGKGLFRITPAKLDDPESVTTVERVPVRVSGAQGLCWAFDSLYANATGKGLFRITDSDGDGVLDAAQRIVPLRGAGEHGPHAVIPTADGKGLYFVGGNHTDPPDFEGSRMPTNWGEDLLLPRQWDARGHARGKLAPGGWIARCDPDGAHVEIVSSGYRNQYDIAIDARGEIFTYDADMEWDIGTPWYRPTRVCHAVSGSEFGWRAGTGKWPTYFEDALPPVIDIGPGSPTGVVFGTGARFPARYQRALFILDWTFGTIYAVHLDPRGASFTAKAEHFLWKKPLPVTDAVVGGDGALYFTVGGRSAQSALYRVTYAGPEPTAPAPVAEDGAEPARRQRRALEAFHGRVDPRAVAAAWPMLGHRDRFVRYAARIAIENQPVDGWRARALGEEDPQTALLALIALARQGTARDLPAVVEALGRFAFRDLTPPQQLALLRAHALAFVRLGKPEAAMATGLAARFDAVFPHRDPRVNTELVRLLTYLQSPHVVGKTLDLMREAPPTPQPGWSELVRRNDSYGGPIARMLANMPPLQNIGYAFMLRNAEKGWSLDRRREYFAFFARAATHPGGMSYAGFLKNIRREAEAKLSAAERHALAPVLGQSLVAPPPKTITPAVGPGRPWTLAGAKQVVGKRLRGRSFARGQNLFHAAACSACHRFDGQGGAIGPDLTTVANKFSIADLLESILEPSATISDQYGSKIVTAKNGKLAVGLVVEDAAGVRVYSTDPTAPPAVIRRADIASIEESKISQMPPGLVNSMNAEELRDLVAYLLSGGNKRDPVFRKQ